MSIVINIYYSGTCGRAKKFAKEMVSCGAVELIRNEDGNEGYEYYFSESDPETVLLIDRWRDQEALDVHHSLPVMGTITELREKYDLSMRVERFTTGEAVPEKDKAYIRNIK